MARRLIGLDVGTNAVALAEVVPGSPHRLERFGQVALAHDAMREGEVVDVAAVAEAVSRLRAEVDVRKAAVRVGIASPRLIVRQVEMPVMSRDELASALRFQAADLIPIPIEEAVLDFAILGTEQSDDGEPVMRVLLAAAQESTVARLVEAVESGGLPVASVDLIPLALVRALGQAVEGNGAGAEGIVSFGGGVTAIAVHEAGVPQFVRVLGSAGRALTDAITADLDIPFETAEALKRQLGGGSDDDLVTRARAAIERPLSVLLDEVRSSLDYYRNQPGAARLGRVVVTGGASQLPGVAERLGALVGVPVELARPRDTLAIGAIGFADEDLPRLDPYLPAAVGLALGGAGIGTVVDLRPTTRRTRVTTTRSRVVGVGAAAGVALVALLAVPTVLARNDLDDKKSERDEVVAQNAQLRSEIAALQEVQAQQQQLDGLRAQTARLLATDVSWARMLQEIGMTIPDNVWLTAFQGAAEVATTAAVAPPVDDAPAEEAPVDGDDTTTTTAPGAVPGPTSAIRGTVTFTAKGIDYPDVAAWITRISQQMGSLTGVWVSNAAIGEEGGRQVVDFASSAQLTDEARSDRLDQMQRGER